MSRSGVRHYFREYVFGFMATDIRREIGLAWQGVGGGNYLVALGLVAYTEALGAFWLANFRSPTENGSDRFYAFFDRLGRARGRSLGDWRRTWETANDLLVYDVVRCGLTHEYLPKVDFVADMGRSTRDGLYEEGRALVMNIPQYFFDFEHEAAALLSELMALDDPQEPPVRPRHPSDKKRLRAARSKKTP